MNIRGVFDKFYDPMFHWFLTHLSITNLIFYIYEHLYFLGTYEFIANCSKFLAKQGGRQRRVFLNLSPPSFEAFRQPIYL